MSTALLTAIGGVLAAFSSPVTAMVQGWFSARGPSSRTVGAAGTAPHEHRPWMVPLATGAWITALALSFALAVSALTASTPIMNNSLVTTSRVVIGLIAGVAVSSGATGIAVTRIHSPGQNRQEIVRGACYVVGGVCVIIMMMIIAPWS